MVNTKDLDALEGIRQRIDNLTSLHLTRAEVAAQKIRSFKPKMKLAGRNEYAAQWLADTTGIAPLGMGWLKRYGPLVARSVPYKRQPERPMTFRQVASKTRVIGAQKVNKDFDKLALTLARLFDTLTDWSQRKQAKAQLQKAVKSIKTSVSANR